MTVYVYDPAQQPFYAGYRPIKTEDVTDGLIDQLAAIFEAGVQGSSGRMYARTEIAEALRGGK